MRFNNLHTVRVGIYVLLMLGICGATPALAQQTIEGTIIDAETAQPLPGVHVFLASRLQGTTTDADGRFKLIQLEPGSYKVVASIIGYASASVVIEIVENQQPGNVALRLTPVVYEMDNLVVESSRSDTWDNQLKRFKSLFLGTSSNAKDSKILNEHALRFDVNDIYFEATATEPLEIDNQGLGYQVTFVLERFRYHKKDELKYTDGTWRFEELTAKSEKEKRNWQRQREYVFKGSLQHLLWAMIHGETESEGFHLLRDSTDRAKHPVFFLHKYHPLVDSTVVRKSDTPHEYKMAFRDFIRVYYERTGDKVRLFSKIKPPPAEQLSYIQMNRSGEATIHESGYLYTPAGVKSAVTVYGYMASRGVADLLPQEYVFQRAGMN